MKHLFLHVGLHKTGTSSIQATLHAHRPTLAAAGITYLDAAANHSALLLRGFAAAADGAAGRRAARIAPGEAEAAQAVLRRFIAEAPPGKLIISGEAASGLGPGGARRLLTFLRAEVDRLTVIAFVRPPRSAVPSLAQQRAKHGATARTLLLAAVPSYRARLEPFLQCADLAETILRPYAPAALRQGCSVAEFLDACGAPPALHGQLRVVRNNPSLSRPALVLLLAANAAPAPGAAADAKARLGRLVRLLAGLPGAPLTIPAPVMDRLLARPHKRDEIAWVEAQLGQPFSAYEAPAPARWAPDAPHPADWAARALADLDAREATALRGLLAGLPARFQGEAQAAALAWLEAGTPPRWESGIPAGALPKLVALLLAVAAAPMPAPRGPGA